MVCITRTLLFLLPGLVQNAVGQVIPSANTRPAATPVAVPGAYSSSNINFVRTWNVKIPISNVATVISPARSREQVEQSTQYFDGLGRKIQTVSKRASRLNRDQVQMNIYDSLGHEQLSYMPYVPKTGNTNDGLFKMDPFNGQKAFYEDSLLNPGIVGESIYYIRKEYEKSPLNRVLKTYAAGNSWALEGGNRPVEMKYLVNSVNDSVRLWNYTAGLPVTTAVYLPGELNEVMKIDQAGKITISYTDKEGRAILTKMQASATPGTGHMGWLCTYNVYDLLGNLVFVISPKAVDVVKGTWTLTTAIANQLCFIYRYDGRKRMMVNKRPGCDSIEMVYDKRDRMVMWRDGLLKGRSQWKAFYYDGLNRERMNGLFNSMDDRAQMQSAMNSAAFDANNSIPFISESSVMAFVYTYYDTYNYPQKYNFSTLDIGKVDEGSNIYSESIPSVPSSMTRGLVTGMRTRVEQDTMFLTSSYYYDRKQRRVQAIEENISGGNTTTNTLYDYDGKVLSTYVKLTNPASTATPTLSVLTNVHYDDNRRIDTVTEKLNDNALYQRTLAVTSYDELDRPKLKRLGVNGASQVESMAYEYNLQSWIRAINKAYLNTPASTANSFGEEISYDFGFSGQEYNGNVAGRRWKSGSDGTVRAYGNTFDFNNRLVQADFSQQNEGSNLFTRDKVDFSVNNIVYDANSNMRVLTQKGMDGLVMKTIDSIICNYVTNSNLLNYVIDRKNVPSSKLGDFKEPVSTPTKDYDYVDGRMSKDLNKGIDSIEYNAHGVPVSMTLNGKGTVSYQTDGQGNKLSKVVDDNTVGGQNITRKYMGRFVFRNSTSGGDSLEYISHPEGRFIPVYKPSLPVAFYDEYSITDYQNSVRAVKRTKKDTSVYAITNELAASVAENAIAMVDPTRTPKPVGYPVDGTTNPNDYVAKLNAGTARVGPGVVIRVMAGDTIQVVCKAFYKSAAASTSASTSAVMASAIVAAFAGSGPVDGVHSGTGAGSPITTLTGTGYDQILAQDPDQDLADKPKAYLKVLAYGDDFSLSNNTVVRQVQGTPDAMQNLVVNKFAVKKTGFVIVFPSNESAVDVYFDNMIITHFTGPLVDVSHYYPLGLKMAGISSSAFAKGVYSQNKMLYTGKELQTAEFKDGTGLELYDMGARMYDAQLGMFRSPDRLADKYSSLSPFIYGAANPARFSDPTGDSLIVPNVNGKPGGKDDLEHLSNQKDISLKMSKAYHLNQSIFSVTIDWHSKTPEQQTAALEADPGLNLLNDMINATDANGNTEYYYYSDGDEMTVIEDATGARATVGDERTLLGEGSVFYTGIQNMSANPRNAVAFTKDELRPPLGTNGMVRISAKGFFYQQFSDGKKGWTQWTNRSSIVFHELYENFQRTHFCQPYEYFDKGPGAHQSAEKAEGSTYGNDNPGNSYFYPLKKP